MILSSALLLVPLGSSFRATKVTPVAGYNPCRRGNEVVYKLKPSSFRLGRVSTERQTAEVTARDGKLTDCEIKVKGATKKINWNDVEIVTVNSHCQRVAGTEAVQFVADGPPCQFKYRDIEFPISPSDSLVATAAQVRGTKKCLDAIQEVKEVTFKVYINGKCKVSYKGRDFDVEPDDLSSSQRFEEMIKEYFCSATYPVYSESGNVVLISNQKTLGECSFTVYTMSGTDFSTIKAFTFGYGEFKTEFLQKNFYSSSTDSIFQKSHTTPNFTWCKVGAKVSFDFAGLPRSGTVSKVSDDPAKAQYLATLAGIRCTIGEYSIRILQPVVAA